MTEELARKGLEPINPANKVQVKNFFKGKNVFITGATGFMGKALVEKLLWSCEDIGNLYLLIRPKKGESAQKRVEDMKKSPVFDRLKQRDERILSKLCAIGGDVSEIDLGISTEDRRLLQDTVSVVFHAASSVRFDDPIKKAVLINIRGTREVVCLAKGMKSLEVIVYVSTIYANSNRPVIEERFYKSSGIDWRTMINSVETLDEYLLNILTLKVIGDLPNTYTYTKKLAESVVYEARHELPVIIFRPSIVTNSIKEPIPGWVENLNGPFGLSTGYLTGVIHCMLIDKEKVTDYIPVDFVTNALIASAWYRGLHETSDCAVIHSAAGDKHHVNSQDLRSTTHGQLVKMPFQRVFWYPSSIWTTNTFVYTILFYLTHLLPAVFIDVVLRAKGEKHRMMKLYQRIFLGNQALAFFLIQDWKIETKNSDTLKTFLHPKDQEIYPFDMRNFVLKEAIELALMGIKKYILLEDTNEAALEANRRKYEVFRILHYLLQGVFYMLVGWLLYKYISLPNLSYII